MRHLGKQWLFGTFIATVVFALQIKATKGESLTSVSRSGQISKRSRDLASVPLILINEEPLLESLSALEPAGNPTKNTTEDPTEKPTKEPTEPPTTTTPITTPTTTQMTPTTTPTDASTDPPTDPPTDEYVAVSLPQS